MNYLPVSEALAASSPLIFFGYRPATRQVLAVSAAYERVLGGHVAAANEELPAWLAALHPDDRTYLTQRWEQVLAGGLLQDVQLRLLRPDGRLCWLSLTATSLRLPGDAADQLVQGYVQDITPTQAVLENAQRYQAKKDSMLEILAHDLASPLTVLEQMADYFADKVETLQDGELNGMIARMRRTCQEGVALIHDFVDQEFLDSANVDLRLVRLDLAASLRTVLDNYQQRQHAAGHRFHFQASHPSIYADIDENKFLQVINNLLGNALKFTPDGGLLSVQLSQHPSHLLVTITDNGIGIPTGQQAGLFERFTLARRPGLRGEKSTGLGMSIIKTIVELHHGRIWVESEEGRGASFFIQLPLAATAGVAGA